MSDAIRYCKKCETNVMCHMDRKCMRQALGLSSAAGSVHVGDKVMIIGGYPKIRGCIGTVQKINTAKGTWCYVTVGGRIHSCKISDLLLQNAEHTNGGTTNE